MPVRLRQTGLQQALGVRGNIEFKWLMFHTVIVKAASHSCGCNAAGARYSPHFHKHASCIQRRITGTDKHLSSGSVPEADQIYPEYLKALDVAGQGVPTLFDL